MPDGIGSLSSALLELADGGTHNLVFTAGGPGPSLRDLTREAMSGEVDGAWYRLE